MKFKKLEDCQALMPFLDKAGEIHKKYILTYEIIFQTLIFLDGIWPHASLCNEIENFVHSIAAAWRIDGNA